MTSATNPISDGMNSEMSTLIVGGPDSPSCEPHPITFTAPATLLMSCSPFFAACLGRSVDDVQVLLSDLDDGSKKRRRTTQGIDGMCPLWRWKEGYTWTICMPIERVEDVRMLIAWLEAESAGTEDVRKDERVGLEENGDSDVPGVNDLNVWRALCEMQPGLRCESIDFAVEEYLVWKIDRQRIRKAKTWQEAEAIENAIDGTKKQQNRGFVDDNAGRDCTGSGSDGEDSDCPPTEPDETDTDHDERQRGSRDARTEESKLPAEHQNHSPDPDASIPVLPPRPPPRPRPAPPVLGPLIRLYILADKYNIDSLNATPTTSTAHTTKNHNLVPNGLRYQITRRLTTIHTLTHTVPHCEDITRLWQNVPVDILGDEGLKEAIVQMFVCLSGREIERLFGIGETGADDGDGAEWNAEFLRAVLVGRARDRKS